MECKITRVLINGAQRFDLPRSIQGSLPCLLIRGISRIDGAYVGSLWSEEGSESQIRRCSELQLVPFQQAESSLETLNCG